MADATQKPTISHGAYHLFMGNLVSTIVLAITSIVVGRLLGPDKFGLYTIVLIIPGYAYLVVRWGLSSTITRYVAKYTSEGNERKALTFGYAISSLHLSAGILVIALLIPFSNVISTVLLHRPELSNGIIIPVALLSVIAQIMFDNGSAAFVGLNQFRKSAIFQIIMALSRFIISLSLLILGYSVLGAVVGNTLGFLVAGVLSFALLASMNKSLIPSDIKESIVSSITYAPTVYVSQLLVAIIPFQSMILAFVVSNKEIGWYSAAVNIAALITLFTYPISTSLLPLFSRSEVGRSELAANYKLTIKYAALFVTPVTMVVMALSTPLATVIYGNAYRFAGNYLLLLAIVSLMAGFGSISYGPFLYGVGKTRKALEATMIGTLISIVTSVTLVVYIGVFGVITGTILGSLISLVLGNRFVSKTLDAKLQIHTVWRIYVASALSALLVYPISLFELNSLLVITIGGVLFILILVPMMVLVKAFTRDDMDALKLQFKEVKLISFLLSKLDSYQRIFER